MEEPEEGEKAGEGEEAREGQQAVGGGGEYEPKGRVARALHKQGIAKDLIHYVELYI